MNFEDKIETETPALDQDNVDRCKTLSSTCLPGTGLARNDDLLTEILLCLPTKVLIRLKLVCKHWHLLISSLHFSRLHTLRHPKLQPSLLLRTCKHLFLYFHPIAGTKLAQYKFPMVGPEILSSCNGLLLLQCCHELQKEYYVYNPTTRQSRQILLSTNDRPYKKVLGLNLAFDALKSSHYKIVCVKKIGKETPFLRLCQIEVYDSETHAWKLRLASFKASVHADFSHGVHLDNIVYWADSLESPVYYDIGKNEIGDMPKIQIRRPISYVRTFGEFYSQVQESNGHLYRVVRINHGERSLAVFELQGKYGEWLFKYKIGSEDLGLYVILNFIREEGGRSDILLFLFFGKIMAYRISDRSFEELVDLSSEKLSQEVDYSRQFGNWDVYQFCESMVPV